MVNSHFRTMGIVALLAGLLAVPSCARTPTHESTGEYVDDSVLTSKVKTALVNDPVTKAREINVKTYRGVVELSGFVDTSAEKSKAETVASSVSGVKMVKNDLELKPK